jgi:hypothetical protein
VKALAKLEALRDMMALRDYVDEGPVGRRRLPRLSREELSDIDAEEDDDGEFEAEVAADAQPQAEVPAERPALVSLDA